MWRSVASLPSDTLSKLLGSCACIVGRIFGTHIARMENATMSSYAKKNPLVNVVTNQPLYITFFVALKATAQCVT